jgi:cell shape-determining protein MreC
MKDTVNKQFQTTTRQFFLTWISSMNTESEIQFNLDESQSLAEQNRMKIKVLKQELKTWEQEFTSLHGRKPEKADIVEVPEIGI